MSSIILLTLSLNKDIGFNCLTYSGPSTIRTMPLIAGNKSSAVVRGFLAFAILRATEYEVPTAATFLLLVLALDIKSAFVLQILGIPVCKVKMFSIKMAFQFVGFNRLSLQITHCGFAISALTIMAVKPYFNNSSNIFFSNTHLTLIHLGGLQFNKLY